MDNPTDDHRLMAVLTHCGQLPVLEFAPGGVIIPEGPNLGRMFVLVEGEVEVLRGETQVVHIAEPGAIFGEIAALLGGPHTATVRAMAPSRLHVIADIDGELRANKELALHIARILARRLVEATTYLADVKAQFAHRQDHFGMVDEVLDALVHHSGSARAAGSRLENDLRL